MIDAGTDDTRVDGPRRRNAVIGTIFIEEADSVSISRHKTSSCRRAPAATINGNDTAQTLNGTATCADNQRGRR